ncbi:type III pantothenate kinase [Methyloradius palustris]|uniref:Type III pantothenate kinase n=1 Tax=Methyloradius palustris TaxID=2778876 RepID=A0A8D5JX20_9PROT|nr:type III pantothenate kinase [Methyloradius palustris]BCM25694.1 hypothetical protein ZMTM_19530 [Methyloradius palustris]
MILAIDAGNTRTKWGVFDAQGAMQSNGVWLNSELMQYENLMACIPHEWQACKQAVISNVAGTRLATVIKAKLAQLSISQCWVVPTKQAANLLNRYESPEKLGSDRWLAMIAVRHDYVLPALVINAGTALTLDALDIDKTMQGVFLGGLILPGLHLMQQSLLEKAADLSTLDVQSGDLQRFPLNTHSAIYSGALSAMAGAVKSMYNKLEQHVGLAPLCIVSGGDAAILIECLQSELLIDAKQLVLAEHLVLKGLYFLERSFAEGLPV